MGFLMLVFLSFCYASFGSKTASAHVYDVTSFGARGDGIRDDTKAFLRAWNTVCNDPSPYPKLHVPAGKTFLISPVAFIGPCKSSSVFIMLHGNIVAPKTSRGWRNCISKRFWIEFSMVESLTIEGPGQFDGQGRIWWGKKALSKTCNRPTALHFHACNNLRLNGTTHIDSPMLHISIVNCEVVNIGNIKVRAPGDSPNTDGIDISASSRINIHDSNFQTGDDCVAINGGVYDMNVTRVFCGPGHGISIGSLGDGNNDTVEKVRVESCNITGTTNGLRIKTVPGGTGYARRILFKDIQLTNVQNPIIIEQHYCNKFKNGICPAPPNLPAVKVSDVTYANIYGSSASKQAITFSCSRKYNCTRINTYNVRITGQQDQFSYCENTHGKFVSTTPHVACS